MFQAETRTGLLVASPQMRDPFFERTVVLLCQHDQDGAIGLVINRSGPITLATVVEQLNENATPVNDQPTWWGGPVGPGTGFVIWRGRIKPDEGWNLGEELAVSPSEEHLNRLIREGSNFNLCLGYAGWGPGQLENEIETGSWIYVDLDEDLLFETPLEERYDKALGFLGAAAGSIWMQPIDE